MVLIDDRSCYPRLTRRTRRHDLVRDFSSFPSILDDPLSPRLREFYFDGSSEMVNNQACLLLPLPLKKRHKKKKLKFKISS